jgi:hypothetical protein
MIIKVDDDKRYLRRKMRDPACEEKAAPAVFETKVKQGGRYVEARRILLGPVNPAIGKSLIKERIYFMITCVRTLHPHDTPFQVDRIMIGSDQREEIFPYFIFCQSADR